MSEEEKKIEVNEEWFKETERKQWHADRTIEAMRERLLAKTTRMEELEACVKNLRSQIVSLEIDTRNLHWYRNVFMTRIEPVHDIREGMALAGCRFTICQKLKDGTYVPHPALAIKKETT